MYYRDEIINYLQANNILASKLDRALTGVMDSVSKQINTIGAGAKRAIYYTSCFTQQYQDVCKKQRNEDVRFTKGLYHFLQHEEVIHKIFYFYFEEILKQKTSAQIECIKEILMTVNIYIAANSLTKSGFAFAVATCVSIGLNLSLNMGAIAGRTASVVVAYAGMYGIVQKAAESADRLRMSYPAFFSTLYANELEMLYFLVEPLFIRADAFQAQRASEADIANIIERMIR
ncbi:hypothetical protein [Pantoea stewartii]|uniref:hypothetical protein n=1 Tax=Pantoea stewartii TaxID=66269 RepID=UPI00162826A4|nr:hypothetical protein [Pantoea stewartii]MBC0852900.1 hypothetical protein [Pantoea stewartii]